MTSQKYYDINGLEIKSGMTLLIGEKNTDVPVRILVFSEMYEDENGVRKELGYEFEETHEFVPLSYISPEKRLVSYMCRLSTKMKSVTKV